MTDVSPTNQRGAERPLLRVVRGEPTPAELAALVSVLAARRVAAARAGGAPPRSAWGAPAALVRRAIAPGPSAWRRSGLPG
jgi:acyl-CoA carboxylase epsilon subunit